MRIRQFPAVIVFAAAFTGLACAQPTPKTALLVLSKHDHTLAIVDPASLRAVAREPVGNDPHEVIASSDGRTAYVSNYGFGAYHTLAVIGLVAQEALPPVDLGPLRGPHGLFFADGEVWFTAEGAKAIGRYSPATGKVDWIMGTGQNRTHMLYVFPGLRRIVTTNVSSGTVTVLDKTDGPAGMPPPPPPGMNMNAGPPPRMPGPPGGDWNETVIPVGHGSEGFDVTPNGKEVWVANAQDGTISIVNLAEKKVTATLDANVPRANRLKITPDGKLALVSMLNGPDLVILDVATHKEVKRLPIGHGSAGVLVQPDGARAYVSCGPDNYVAVIDMKALEVVGHIDAGGEPDGLAWAVQR
ncbi:MAG: YncE family protein [Acidobacteriota bacterium]|nr:YncE family protein [Acidobacteriota bacterium]